MLSAAACFFAGFSGFFADPAGPQRSDLVSALYFGLLAAVFYLLAFFLRPAQPKRLPRALHFVLGGVLALMLLAISMVFFGGGVIDPGDVWVMGWLAALAALAFWRGARKR